MKLLFVCLGNICRSPIAEGIMTKLVTEAGLNWIVDSAGTNGFHTGEPPHKFSQKVCLANGIDISHQQSIQFKADFIIEYDYIFVMAKDVYKDACKICGTDNLPNLHYFLDSLYPNQQKDVTDPWYGTEAGYLPVYNQIKEGCEAWFNTLQQQ
jgi:protein-tyrosine phosphatase